MKGNHAPLQKPLLLVELQVRRKHILYEIVPGRKHVLTINIQNKYKWREVAVLDALCKVIFRLSIQFQRFSAYQEK